MLCVEQGLVCIQSCLIQHIMGAHSGRPGRKPGPSEGFRTGESGLRPQGPVSHKAASLTPPNRLEDKEDAGYPGGVNASNGGWGRDSVKNFWVGLGRRE